MSRLAAALAATSLLALAVPAAAQDHANMPGMAMPMPAKKAPAKKPPARKAPARKAAPARPAAPKPAPRKPAAKPAAATPAAPGMADMPGMDHSGQGQAAPMDHGAMPMNGAPAQPGTQPDAQADTMPGMDHSAMPGMAMPGSRPGHEMEMTGTALPAGNDPAPPPPRDHYADRQFPAAEMARARTEMMRDSGGQTFGQALLNIFEYQMHKGADGYRWDGEAFYGGDINRLWLKSEGEGEVRRGLDSGEVQALYSRAIDPYFNLQAGVRQDIGRGPRRTYATVGIEGLAPGFFEVEAALFLSNKGDLLGRLEGYYDQRITQRLVFQPRVELNFAAQDVPENDIGSGLVNYELGGRLRYEIARQFAPYIGVSFYQKTGNTARFARNAGENVHGTSFVTGIRFWF